MPEWRNGKRSGLKIRRPNRLRGSTPLSGTIRELFNKVPTRARLGKALAVGGHVLNTYYRFGKADSADRGRPRGQRHDEGVSSRRRRDGVTMEKPNYDPGVIEEFAARLYARAKTIMLSYGLLGFLIGILMVGALSVKAGREDSNGVFLILAVAIPTLIGVFVGRARGFALRLQAQQALCQVAIEKNTFALRGLMASTQPRT